MIYEYPLAVPSDTTRSDNLIYTLSLSVGTLSKIEIIFPPGCAALVHLIIVEREQQLWPANPGASFVGDTYPLIYHPNYIIDTYPYELFAHVWSDDVRHEHTPIVSCEIIPLGTSWVERMIRLFAGA